MSGSLNELVECLRATLSPEAQIRQHAESYLIGNTHPGFCISLIQVVQSPDPTIADVRQSAAVVLRRHIQRNWASEDADETTVQISDAEKAQVRHLLPASLAEPNSRIQTAVGMAIAEIGKSDCPHIWPDLLPGLVHAVKSSSITQGGRDVRSYVADKSNNPPHVVVGAVRCLALLVEDLSEEQVVEMAPVVLPELLNIVQNEAHLPSLRRLSLSIFKTCLGALELMYKQSPQAANILHALLEPWLQTISSILGAPTSADLSSLWGIKFEALGCLLRIVRSFNKPAADFLPPVLSSCWGMFVSCAPLYDELVVHGQGDEQGVDDALEGISFTDLVSQLFELLLALLGNNRLLPMLRPAFPQLAYVCVGYMQASQESIQRWTEDVNEFLESEGDFWGARTSGELLLDELIESGGAEGLSAVNDAVQQRISEATAAQQGGNGEWWVLKEAALLAVGAVAERCVKMRRKNKPLPPSLDPEVAATVLLSGDLAPGSNAPPFLIGRGLWLFFKWAPALPSGLRSAALQLAGTALAPGNPGLVQAGACQALSRLLKGASAEDVQAVSEQAFAGLAAMLPLAEEDSLHLVVETLTVLVKADPAGAARWSPHLISSSLKVWVDNITDPLLGEDSEDLLRALASTPGCLAALQTSAVPTLIDVVSNPTSHTSLLVAGCVDMLVLVVQPSTVDAAAAVCAAVLPPVLRLLRGTDDEDIAGCCATFLRTALQVGGPAALTWWGGGDAAVGAVAMVQAVQYLLRPETQDMACRNVGGLVLELFRHASAHVVRLSYGFLSVLFSSTIFLAIECFSYPSSFSV